MPEADTSLSAYVDAPVVVFGINFDKLGFYLKHLRRQRRVLLKAGIAGLVLSTLLAFVIPKKYEANAVLMPPDAINSNSLAAAAMLGAGASSALGQIGQLLGDQSPGQMIVAALGTDAIFDRIITRFHLKQVYGTDTQEATRKKLDNRTDFDEDLKSGLVTITVRDREAKRAAEMANAFPEELQRLLVETKISAAEQERSLIEEPLKRAKQQLDEATAQLSQFSAKNTTLDPDVQGKAMVDTAAMVEGQLIAEESQLKALQQIYTERHERVQAARARIAELRAQLTKLGGDPAAKPTDQLQEMYPSIRKLPGLGATYYDLYRKVKVREAVYVTLQSDYEITKAMGLTSGPKIQVLSTATVPDDISFPPRLLLILAGTFAWLFAAGVLIIVDASAAELAILDPRRRAWEDFVARVRRSRSYRLGMRIGNKFRRGRPVEPVVEAVEPVVEESVVLQEK